MKVLMIILLLAAVVLIGVSVVMTVKIFAVFGTELSAEERKNALLGFRTRILICYAAAVVLITSAALIKMFLM